MLLNTPDVKKQIVSSRSESAESKMTTMIHNFLGISNPGLCHQNGQIS